MQSPCVSRPVEPWVLRPYRPISWWELREFSGQRLFWVGSALQEVITQCLNDCAPDAIYIIAQPISDSLRGDALERLRPVEGECLSLGLAVTAETAKELVTDLERDPETRVGQSCHWLMDQVRGIRKLMEKEMRNKLFFHVPPDRMRFLPLKVEPYFFSKQVSERFRSTNFDAEEAAVCLMCGRATAGVFHLMRVLESSLAVLGKVFDVSLEHTSWAPALDEIESKIRNMHKDPVWKARPDCKEMQSFYSQAAAQFGIMKDAWRNHTMHVRAKYTEEEAGQIFDAVKAFMQKLTERLSEDEPK